MIKVLITYAVREELVSIEWEDTEISYVCTGIGKTKATYQLTETIHQVKPDIVINVGTDGTLQHQVGDIFVCQHFIDRDFQKLAGLGLEYEIDTTEVVRQKGICINYGRTGICNTGDSFMTEEALVEGDVVDMEAYAQAFVCHVKEIPFVSVKYVTDIIGQNSVKHWKDKLAEARKGLHLFLNGDKLSRHHSFCFMQ